MRSQFSLYIHIHTILQRIVIYYSNQNVLKQYYVRISVLYLFIEL